MASFFLFFFLLSFSSSSTAADDDNHHIYRSFIQCFSQSNNASTAAAIVHPMGSSSYDSLRRSNRRNFRFETPTVPKPAFIVTPTEEPHVQWAVVCSRRLSINLRTESAGHDYEGLSSLSLYSSPFAVVDLRHLRAISVDVPAGMAWAQAGATLGELYYAIAAKTNLYGFPAGLCPTVGLGGHVSGGGWGTMVRKYGLAADNVVDARIVVADGRILDKDAMGEDLFWAIRGGGGASFGVIVAFKLRLAGVPPAVAVFSVNRTREQRAVELVHRWQFVAPKLPDELYIKTHFQSDFTPASPVVAMFEALYLGSCPSLLATMDGAFPELGILPGDCVEMPWIRSAVFYDFLTAVDPRGVNRPTEVLLERRSELSVSTKGKSDFVAVPMPVAAVEALWERVSRRPPGAMILVDLTPYGGRMSAIADDETPFPHRRGVLYNLHYCLTWLDGPASAERSIEWMRDLYASMAEFVTREPRQAYLNYRDIDLGMNDDGRSTAYEAARASWGEKYFVKNFRRLAKAKAAADPDNFFWYEQSVPPLAAGADELDGTHRLTGALVDEVASI